MALDVNILKSEIADILNDLKKDTDQSLSIEKFSTSLANAIDNYLKSAQVVGTDSVGGAITGELI